MNLDVDWEKLWIAYWEGPYGGLWLEDLSVADPEQVRQDNAGGDS